MSVMRVAAPPADGMVQMLPCRSTASVRPSGETATDIDVPSCTETSTSTGPAAGAPLSDAVNPRTPIANHLRPMNTASRRDVRVFYAVGGPEIPDIFGVLCRNEEAGRPIQIAVARHRRVWG